jgi:hypothetical protein
MIRSPFFLVSKYVDRDIYDRYKTFYRVIVESFSRTSEGMTTKQLLEVTGISEATLGAFFANTSFSRPF